MSVTTPILTSLLDELAADAANLDHHNKFHVAVHRGDQVVAVREWALASDCHELMVCAAADYADAVELAAVTNPGERIYARTRLEAWLDVLASTQLRVLAASHVAVNPTSGPRGVVVTNLLTDPRRRLGSRRRPRRRP
ncbi:hypothetical protein ACIGO9_30765 [Nocardia asteroides]|uniref:hypothetical protein n=1 Tax=Nocardia asteroides TaxID=1824 RepID=UPI0037CBDBE5